MVNTAALESRGRGFKSHSRQFLEFQLCSPIPTYIYIDVKNIVLIYAWMVFPTNTGFWILLVISRKIVSTIK